MTEDVIYLDYNASTPLDPEVSKAMIEALNHNGFCNPSSSHKYGVLAKNSVIKSRQQVADLINAEPDEIMFCGGSESV